ncbi:MAG: type II toxin-antitoxin system VapC family toxin [Pseudomonadota bacterium]
MIVLDTNVISELMRRAPHKNVALWVSQQKPENLCITSITLGEVLRGIDCIAEKARRDDLTNRFLTATANTFSGRIYPYDQETALHFGKLCAQRKAANLSIDAVDIMIAAVAKNLGAKIATRNIKDFKKIGISLIDPWKAPVAVK